MGKLKKHIFHPVKWRPCGEGRSSKLTVIYYRHNTYINTPGIASKIRVWTLRPNFLGLHPVLPPTSLMTLASHHPVSPCASPIKWNQNSTSLAMCFWDGGNGETTQDWHPVYGAYSVLAVMTVLVLGDGTAPVRHFSSFSAAWTVHGIWSQGTFRFRLCCVAAR